MKLNLPPQQQPSPVLMSWKMKHSPAARACLQCRQAHCFVANAAGLDHSHHPQGSKAKKWKRMTPAMKRGLPLKQLESEQMIPRGHCRLEQLEQILVRMAAKSSFLNPAPMF